MNNADLPATGDSASIHGMWSSRLVFILAATGSAVGLGNIWRFPYVASDNGGGAFVLLYLACIAILGLPILIAEVLVGRQGRRSPVHSVVTVSEASGAAAGWGLMPVMGVIAALMILSFYSVVAGWTLHYTWLYLQQVLGMARLEDPGAAFGALLGDPLQLGIWHGVFMVLTMAVVAMGVEKGLERAVRWLMPALFVMLLLLVGYGLTTGHAGAALHFLFEPDFSKVSGATVLAAMGQAFFTLSLGSCAMMAYGAYLPRDKVSLPRTAGTIALTDTLVALLAGMAIFPIVIAYGLNPEGGGPGLIFTSLPHAFNDMPFGSLYGLLFFALLSVAAWTSSISMLEPGTAWLSERFGLGSRKRVALGLATFCWLLGLLAALSLNRFAHIKIAGRDIMGLLEFVASDLLLPLGGMLIALFVGWAMDRRLLRGQLPEMPEWAFSLFRALLRFVAPALVLVVLLRAVL